MLKKLWVTAWQCPFKINVCIRDYTLELWLGWVFSFPACFTYFLNIHLFLCSVIYTLFITPILLVVSKIGCLQCIFWTTYASPLPNPCSPMFGETLKHVWGSIRDCASVERNIALRFMHLIKPQHSICHKIRIRLFETFHLSSNTTELQEACFVFLSEVWMLLSRFQRMSTEQIGKKLAHSNTAVVEDLSRSLQMLTSWKLNEGWKRSCTCSCVVVPRLYPIPWNTFSALLALHWLLNSTLTKEN